MKDAMSLRRTMVDQMISEGHLRTRPWISAFTDVRRHLFLPRFFRQTADYAGWLPVSERDADWLALVYTDATWVTQLDNDAARWRAGGGPVTGVPTSSSTAPGLMALMLEALDVDDGAKVLEVGTGTGYNAGLLAHRLHSELVTSVEVDSRVAESARLALLACGYTPTLIVGDGMAGHPGNAPYDRIIATCSAARIPEPWIAQLRPGGQLLTNLHRDLGGGALAKLRRDSAGRLCGSFLADYGGFMPVRSDPPANAQRRLAEALAVEEAQTSNRATDITADDLDDPHFGMLAALRLPGVTSLWFEPDAGRQRWLLADDSWASVHETTATVTQSGVRSLWDEVETLHRRWVDAGSPTRDRFGLTITRSGLHQFWLDSPDVVWWSDPDQS